MKKYKRETNIQQYQRELGAGLCVLEKEGACAATTDECIIMIDPKACPYVNPKTRKQVDDFAMGRVDKFDNGR